jgi:hypothetical protein
VSCGAGDSAGSTTTVSPATDPLASFIAGVIAGEGCFTSTGSPRPRFRFAVGLGGVDASTCELLHTYFGVGSIWFSPRRKAHYDDEVTFSVQSLKDLVEVVVPFADQHLLHSHKRDQYLAWRARLLEYWETRARNPSAPCRADGCTRPSRAKGLCRGHYYAEYGQ